MPRTKSVLENITPNLPNRTDFTATNWLPKLTEIVHPFLPIPYYGTFYQSLHATLFQIAAAAGYSIPRAAEWRHEPEKQFHVKAAAIHLLRIVLRNDQAMDQMQCNFIRMRIYLKTQIIKEQ